MVTKSASENTTEIKEWSLPSLKAYLELKINSLENETNLQFQARDMALKLQFELDQQHFKSLNNEAARILKATEITVSRDVWDGFQVTYQEWRAKIDRDILPRNEFLTYKETTDKERNLGVGKYQGVLQLITTIASIASIVGVAYLMLK